MKKIWGTLLVSILLSGALAFAFAGPLTSALIRAQQSSQEFTGEDVVREALEVLRLWYPERTDPIMLFNAAIRGMAERIGKPDILVPVPPRAEYVVDRFIRYRNIVFRVDYADHFIKQRDIAFQAAAGNVTRLELEFAATKAMLEALNDSHTYFISPEVAKEFMARLFGKPGYSIIGAYFLYMENRIYVSEIVPGGPADKAGLKRFDRILKVDGLTVDGLPVEAVDRVIKTIRGPEGTVVRITVQRFGRPDPFTVVVTRASAIIPSMDARLIADNIGYIRLRGFDSDSSEKFAEAISRLARSGMRALVIDIRYNKGGLIDEVEKILSAIMPAKVPILREAYRYFTKTIYTSGKPVIGSTIPVAILVDEDSASGAEIMSAAIQEYRRGIVIGVKTRGAVEMAIYRDLSAGAMMVVTIARLRTGKGMRLEKVGVTPDIPVHLKLDDLDAGRDSQLNAAMREVLSRINP